jgi:hypothetical protein
MPLKLFSPYGCALGRNEPVLRSQNRLRAGSVDPGHTWHDQPMVVRRGIVNKVRQRKTFKSGLFPNAFESDKSSRNGIFGAT